MVEIRRILYPIDFSDCSYMILPYVMSFAQKYDAEVYLLHVAHDLHYYAGLHIPHPSLAGLMREVFSECERMMDRVCDEHLMSCPNFRRRLVAGKPGKEILKLAEEEDIDLIIMGTHGRKGIERTIYGSVASYVIENAKVPVLIVNPFGLKGRSRAVEEGPETSPRPRKAS